MQLETLKEMTINVWKLGNVVLDSPWVYLELKIEEDISMPIRKYFELNTF